MTDGNIHEGGCLCGRVRFRVQGPTLWCAHCHCSQCRRAHGAPFVTWVGVPEEAVRIEAGDGDLAWHASSAEARRGFCRTCGSSLFFRSSRWPGELHIARGNFDGELDREPAAHVFWDSHVSWFEPGDVLPRKPG